MAIIDSIMESMNLITEATVYNKNGIKLSVNTTSGATGQGASYFKYHDTKKHKVCRIIITEPEYTIHRNNAKTSGGKEKEKNFKLSEYQKRELMEILQSEPDDQYKKLGLTTVYSAIAYEANKAAHVSLSDIEKYKNNKLKETPQYVIPYNMEIPDYTEL